MAAPPEPTIPIYFRCPVSLELMKDPVTLPTGITYDRRSIDTWLRMGNATCPVTKQNLPSCGFDLIPNHTIRRMILSWCAANSLTPTSPPASPPPENVSVDSTRHVSVSGLVNLLKESASPKETKAALLAMHDSIISSAGEKTGKELAGAVPAVVEIVADSVDRSTCEKALALLDALFDCHVYRHEAYDHALSAPVLVKKMLRVSDASTELAVSALWKLCKSTATEAAIKVNDDSERERFLEEALNMGAFQKLLLLLQLGCGGATREKTTEVLKTLNAVRGKLDCGDTIGFKGLKKPK